MAKILDNGPDESVHLVGGETFLVSYFRNSDGRISTKVAEASFNEELNIYEPSSIGDVYGGTVMGPQLVEEIYLVRKAGFQRGRLWGEEKFREKLKGILGIDEDDIDCLRDDNFRYSRQFDKFENRLLSDLENRGIVRDIAKKLVDLL